MDASEFYCPPAFGADPHRAPAKPEAAPLPLESVRIRQGAIDDYAEEIRRLYEQLYGVCVNLQVSLSATTTSGNDTYKVPSDRVLVIKAVHGYLRFTDFTNEVALAAVLGTNVAPTERAYVKAQNCLVELKNADRSMLWTERNNPPLATLMPRMGRPLELPKEMPFILQPTETMKASFSLQDTTAAIIGAATIYGVSLVGALIPHKR